jgi:hypothetical protein
MNKQPSNVIDINAYRYQKQRAAEEIAPERSQYHPAIMNDQEFNAIMKAIYDRAEDFKPGE